MEKDFLTDQTLSLDDAIAKAQSITPDDDPQFDPVLPSQLNTAEKAPSKHTISMDKALKTYRLKMDSIEGLTRIANGDITTHFWGNLAKGAGDFIQEMKMQPAKFDGMVYRAFNGHVWPNMTEDEAVRLMDSATSYVANQERLRNLIVQSQGGADSLVRPLGSGALQVLSLGIVGLMTGGAGIGALAGLQEASDISQEFAEKAMEENGGTLRGYDNREDALYAALHGIISGYIETQLGVENLFTGAAKNTFASRLGTQILKSAAGEGVEEFLQESSKFLFENMAGKNNRTGGEFLKDALTNAVYGAILGGAFSIPMYQVNKLRINKALRAQGFTDVEADAITNDMIDNAKKSILQEVDTRSQLREHYGEQWTGLKNKVITALENAGWKETHPEIDLEKYAADNADDIVRPLFNMSNKFGIDTRDLLQLADIDVIDNAIYLKPMNLGSAEVIANRIREKKEQVKRLNILARTGAGNPETKRTLNTQIELLQKYYEKLTGDRLNLARRTRAGKARLDAEVLASTAPAVSETIANIDISQMSSGEPTTQIREKLDGQPFVYVGDKQLPVEYKVVSMDEVIASHIGQDINTNYSLKELQNRAQRGSRTDVSILQSRAAKIQPENLGIAYNTQNGAPVVNDKGEVIAGNGRYEVLRMTDEKGRARYNKYLESLGLDLTGIKDPILVRVMHNLTPEQQIAVADASNVSATSAFDNASQAAQDAKLLKGTNGVTDFLNKIPIESRQGLFLANDRVNKVALDRRYNDALMMWLLNNDTELYEELYLMGGITQKIQTALNQVIPQLMSLENQYPDVGLRQDLANALKRLPQISRQADFAFAISQVEIDDGRPDLFNENALLYALNFGKNTKTWEGTGADRTQVGLTLSEFFDTYTQKATTNQENIGQVDMFGEPLAVEQSRSDLLAETLTLAFPREFEDNVAKTRDMKAVFLTKAQTAPTQLNQMDLLDTVQPSLFPDDTSTASAVRNLPWETPVNVSNPTFFNRMPDANDIEVARNNGIDSFLILDKNEVPSKLVLLDGSVIGLKPGAKIPSGKDLYKPNQLFQEQLDLANENARLDDIYPAYEGETIDINGKDRSVYNSAGERIAKSAEALRNFYKWFGDSKVVDEQGRPLVVYHGTNAEFDTFEKDRIGDFGKGYYFTTSRENAEQYATRKGGDIVMPVYLSIQNIYEAPGNAGQFLYNLRDKKTSAKQAQGVLLEQGFNGIEIKQFSGKEKYFVAFEPNQIKSTDNRGTYSRDTGNIYNQGRSVNGFYDPELEVIVLGRSSNTGTLPHEMSHYWANTIFNLVKSGKYNNNPDFMAQAMGMFRMLGVGMNQDTLTRDQQEQFASMTEAVIFGMAPIPQGTELPMTAFLNWVPQKYKSILDIGYRNSEGRIVNPILDKQAVEWFNAWYANGTLPAIEMSPLTAENSNGEIGDRIIPSTAEVMKTREAEMTAEADRLKRARTDQTTEAMESTPLSERAAAAAAEVDIESKPDNLKLSEPPAEKKKNIVSYLIPGRGTNTREGMFQVARDYLKKEPEHAREVAFGNPALVQNDTGVDRAILIRALMEEYKRGDPEYAELYHNLAETVSLAGKTPGLSNDMNFQYYRVAMDRIRNGMEAKAAIKYAGTRNLNKARRTFNADIDAFIQEHAAKILDSAPDTDKREMLIKQMLAEATLKFGGETATQLNQEDLRRGRSIKSGEREVFIEWANREIRKKLKAEPDINTINKTMELSEKAQKALKSVNSDDLAEAQAAVKQIREWQMFVADNDVPETWYSRLIGSWYPKAMLYNINTHSVNILGTGINYGMVEAALEIQYGKGKVSKSAVDAEKKRLRALYDSNLVSLAGMMDPTSPTLLHGEQYNPREGRGLGAKAVNFSMDLLGKEDNWFKVQVYVDALNRIATADAAKTGESPTELFRLYKRLDNPKDSRAYQARQEAVVIAQTAVFQQTGVLSTALKKGRDALNNLTIFGYKTELGTLLAPFVKTPANIVEQGARAIAAPIRVANHAIKSDWKNWSVQDTLDVGYFVLGCVLGAAAMVTDYEPPYEAPHKYDPNKPYDSIKTFGGAWIKLDTFGIAAVPMRVMASLMTGKGLGVAGTLNDIPLVGDLVESYQQAAQIEQAPYTKGTRFVANLGYNRINTAVPAIARYTIAAMHPADIGLENLDLGLPKTGIGRKIKRQYGLDGGDTTTNDILRIFFNRLKIVEE